jgi:tetratricopeptide (TPR) repeat protein
MFGATPWTDGCKARSGRGIRCRHAIVLAAGLVAGQLSIAPATADYASDSKDCFTVDYSEKRVDACTRVINSGRMKGKDLAGALQTRAEGYRLAKQYEKALADFDRALEIAPGLAQAYSNRAEVYRTLGQYEKVIGDTTEAIRLDPTYNAFFTVRGLAYQQQGELSLARADYNKALAIPVKGADGGWAQDVARNRLKEIESK